MKILLLLAHATPAVRDRYQSAVGDGVRAVPFVAPALPGVLGGGLSSRYTSLAAKLRRAPGAAFLPALLAWLGLLDKPTIGDARIVIGWYSAGYALARELALAPTDRAEIAGWLGIDGGHAPKEADGSPDDRSIAWLVRLCRDAAAGRTALAYGHTDVDPMRYASTGSTIGEALRLAGVQVGPAREACPGCAVGVMGVRASGSLLVETHNHHANPTREHGAALFEWGPALATRATAMVREAHDLRVGGRSGDDAHVGSDAGGEGEDRGDARGSQAGDMAQGGCEAPPRAGLGELALAAALNELRSGASENPPGSNGGPLVAKYLRGAQRDGRPVGITSGAWCAGFASWCDRQAVDALHRLMIAERQPLALAEFEGRTITAPEQARRAEVEARIDALEAWQFGRADGLEAGPVLWRAAVWELVEDARRSGAWREAGEYSPMPGDLAVFRRAGQDPRVRGCLGHVGRVETAPDDNGRYLTIDGNSGHDSARVARVERNVLDADLCGWISYQKHESANR